jgi:hypothetical protein
MTPVQHALHLLAFGTTVIASVLLAPLSLLLLGAISLAAFIEMMSDAGNSLGTMAKA